MLEAALEARGILDGDRGMLDAAPDARRPAGPAPEPESELDLASESLSPRATQSIPESIDL
jgi:hypothetical protein